MTSTGTLARKAARNGPTVGPATTKRVAIYTRQSIDRGDDYGSCEAQRDLLLSFLASQKAQGWTEVPDRYDDVGYSGGTIDRPAFARLLRDVDDGKVDVILSYKIDRVSRSVADLCQLLQRFETKGIEFVSVGQGISTARSNPASRMLTQLLGVFSEFERSQVRERVSMKAAAIRRTGITSGQRPVLGLDPIGAGKLKVNPDEAAIVRKIYARFIELESVTRLAHELREQGITNKTWTNRKGDAVQGRPFDVPGIRRLLSNPLYAGKVSLGDEIFAGQHAAIVDAETFDAAQRLLGQRVQRRTTSPSAIKHATLLQGVAACHCGASLTHHYSSRGNRRYAYYTCTRYQKAGAAACPGSRVAVGELDSYCLARIRAIGRDPALVAETIAAAREQLAARKPEIEAELARIATEREKLEAEKTHLVAAIGAGAAAGTSALVNRMGEIDTEIAALDAPAAALRQELLGLDGAVIDEAELRAALSAFDPLWEQLTAAERARLLRLLIDRITFNGTTSEVAITFRANGLRALARDGRAME